MHCFVNFWYYSWDHNICCDHPSVDRSPVTEEREMIWFMICLLVFFVSENKSCVNIKYKEARVFILVLTFHFFVTEKHGADSPRSSFGWLLLLVWVDQGLHWLGWSRQGSFSGQSKLKTIEFEICRISTMGNSGYRYSFLGDHFLFRVLWLNHKCSHMLASCCEQVIAHDVINRQRA